MFVLWEISVCVPIYLILQPPVCVCNLFIDIYLEIFKTVRVQSDFSCRVGTTLKAINDVILVAFLSLECGHAPRPVCFACFHLSVMWNREASRGFDEMTTDYLHYWWLTHINDGNMRIRTQPCMLLWVKRCFLAPLDVSHPHGIVLGLLVFLLFRSVLYLIPALNLTNSHSLMDDHDFFFYDRLAKLLMPRSVSLSDY